MAELLVNEVRFSIDPDRGPLLNIL
jgi:hypothetical protein